MIQSALRCPYVLTKTARAHVIRNFRKIGSHFTKMSMTGKVS